MDRYWLIKMLYVFKNRYFNKMTKNITKNVVPENDKMLINK